MKLKVGKRVHYESGPDMTPLVDVVMVLLIFLMMIGSFEGLTHYLSSNLPPTPTGLGGTPPDPNFVPNEPLTIKIDSPAGDQYVARADRVQGSDRATFAAGLKQMREQLNATGKKTDDIQVLIIPNNNVKTKHTIEVFDAVNEAGFTKVGFGDPG